MNLAKAVSILIPGVFFCRVNHRQMEPSRCFDIVIGIRFICENGHSFLCACINSGLDGGFLCVFTNLQPDLPTFTTH